MRPLALLLLSCSTVAAQTSQPAAFLHLTSELRFPGGAVSALAITRDGTLVASGGENGAVQVHDFATRQRVAAFDAVEGNIAQLAFAPDGRRLAVFGADLSFWSVPAGRLLQRHGVTCSAGYRTRGQVSWSDDGRWFAFPGAGNRVTVLDAKTLAPLASQEYGDWLVHALAFSRDGERLFVGQREGSTTVWHWQRRGPIEPIAGAHGETGLAVVADGRLLRGRYSQGGFVLGDVTVSDDRAVTQVAAAPDGSSFALLQNGRRIAVCDADGKEQHGLQGPDERDVCFALGAAGRLAAAGPSGRILLWQHGAPAGELDGLPARADGVAFSGDGSLLAVRRSLHVAGFDLATGRRHELPDCAAIATGKEPREIAALQQERFVRLDAQSGEVVAGQDLPKTRFGLWPVTSGDLALSPDGRQAAAALCGHVWLLDLVHESAVTVAETIFDLRGAGWSNDGTAVLAVEVRRMCGNSPRSCDLWLVAPHRAPRELVADDLALAVDWAPDDRSLLVASRKQIERRRLPDLQVTEGTAASVRWLRHLDQGRALAHDGTTITLWRTEPLRLVASQSLPQVATTPDGTPKQGWDLASIFDFDPGTRHVHAAALSRDGRRVAFAGSRAVFVFDVAD